MNEQEFNELSAGYALGSLSPSDETAFAAALEAHPEWAELVDEDIETAAFLADDVPEVQPSAHIRAQLMIAVNETAHSEATDLPNQSLDSIHLPETITGGSASGAESAEKPHWRKGMFALVASIAVLSAIALGPKIQSAFFPPPAELMALQEIQDAPDATSASTELEGGGEATAHWSGEVGKAVLVSDGLPALEEGRTYELWFIRGETPLPAGTFDAEDGTSTALLVGEMEAGDTIAVTIEQTGGSPDGLPTTDAVVVIETV